MKCEMTFEEVYEDEFVINTQGSERYNLLLGPGRGTKEYEVSISGKILGTFFLSIIRLSITVTPLTMQSDLSRQARGRGGESVSPGTWFRPNDPSHVTQADINDKWNIVQILTILLFSLRQISTIHRLKNLKLLVALNFFNGRWMTRG